MKKSRNAKVVHSPTAEKSKKTAGRARRLASCRRRETERAALSYASTPLMSPPLGSLALAAVAAIVGGYVLIERAPHLLHAAPEGPTPEVASAAAFPIGPQPRWVVDPPHVRRNLPPAG